MTSASCDDVTSAFAVIVAVADASVVSPAPPAPPASAVSPPPPAAPQPVPPAEPREAPARPIEWRLGARAFIWSHGPAADYRGDVLGGLGVLSVELPWGLPKMMFELGLGASSSIGAIPGQGALGQSVPAALPESINYVLIDTQACLLDLPVEKTGLSVLGCFRIGVASYKSTLETGGVWWVGPGLRLRWQSPFSVFLEAGTALVLGTTTAGAANSPTWAEGAASLGFKL